jgi:hypothetical protein
MSRLHRSVSLPVVPSNYHYPVLDKQLDRCPLSNAEQRRGNRNSLTKNGLAHTADTAECG